MSLHFKEGTFTFLAGPIEKQGALAPLCPLSVASLVRAETQALTRITREYLQYFCGVLWTKMASSWELFPLGSVYNRAFMFIWAAPSSITDLLACVLQAPSLICQIHFLIAKCTSCFQTKLEFVIYTHY